jgi:hypothetical protein
MNTTVTMLTPTTNAGDITLTGGGNLTITSAGSIPLKNAKLGAKVVAAAAVASNYTILFPTIGNSTTYAIAINQMVNGQLIQQVVSSTTPASGGTAATVTADLKLKAEAFGFSFASFTLSTLTITAVGSTANPVFTISAISNITTVTQAVAGSVAVGDYNDVLALGGTPVVGTTYDRYNYSVTSNDIAVGGSSAIPIVSNGIIFVDKTTNGTNATTFGIGWTNVTQGYTVAAGVAVNKAAITTAGATSAIALAAAINLQAGMDSFNQQTAS